MSTGVLAGASIVRAPRRFTWKKDVGGHTVQTITGNASDIVAEALMFRNQGWETEIEEGKRWTLTATINVDLATNPNELPETPITKWEMVPQSRMQSLLSMNRSYINLLPIKARENIKMRLKNPQSTVDFLQNVEGGGGLTPLAINMRNAATRAFVYLQMGVEGKLIDSYILRRTAIVDNEFDIGWETARRGMVLSTNDVANSYGVPSNWRVLMPGSGYETITVKTDSYMGGGVAPGDMEIPFFSGWLEYSPSMVTVNSNQSQITQEWHYDRYIVGSSFGNYDTP